MIGKIKGKRQGKESDRGILSERQKMAARGNGWSEIIDGERAETSVTSSATTDVEG